MVYITRLLPLLAALGGARLPGVHAGEDLCIEGSPILAQAISYLVSCVGISDGTQGLPGCNVLGVFCPVSCGLCDAMGFGPPTCSATEIREAKTALAETLRNLGVCEDCAAPDDDSLPMEYRLIEANLPLTFNTGTYTTSDPRDPCSAGGVTCNRCGQAVHLAYGQAAPVPLGYLSESIFKAVTLQTMYLQRAGAPQALPVLDSAGWRNFPNLTSLITTGVFSGDLPDFSASPWFTFLRISDAGSFSGNVNSVFASGRLAVIVLIQDDPAAGVAGQQLDETICKNAQSLEVLDIVALGTIGPLPACMEEMTKIRIIRSIGNFWTGDAAPLLSSPGLQEVIVQGGSQLSGPLPTALENAMIMRILQLPDNRFTGTLPEFKSPVLKFLSLDGNQISDSKPLLTGNRLVIRLANNNFTSIPAVWWNLPEVTSLDLSFNQITRWPEAGLQREGLLSSLGTPAGCGEPFAEERFDWPNMERIILDGNPLSGNKVRTFWQSLGYLPRISVVSANDCGFEGGPGDEGPFLTMDFDMRNCPDLIIQQGFTSLTTMQMRNNGLTELPRPPWPGATQVDLSGNHITVLHPNWLGATSPAILDLRGNPEIRAVVAPPAARCSDTDPSPVANPFDFRLVSGTNYECTSLCASAGIYASVDATANSTSLCRCTAGNFGFGDDCQTAPADTFAPVGAAGPTPCPARSSTLGTGSASIDDCRCNPGYYKDISAATNEVTCKACPRNTYKTISGALSIAECEDCPQSTESQEGSTECTDCPNGTRAGIAGEGCIVCEPGKYAVRQGITECTLCAVGWYQPLAGQQGCLECEGENEQTWEWSEVSQTFLSKDGATSREQCGCRRGYHRPDPQGQCIECDAGASEGLECPGGTDDRLLTLKKGYYSQLPVSVYRCWGDEFRCPGSRSPGDSCADGRRGLTCALCVDGKVPAARGECETCKAGSAVMLPIAIICGTLALVAIYYMVDRHSAVVQSHAMLSAALATSLFITVVQQMGVISIMSVEWTDPVKSIFQMLRLLAFDIEILQLGCVANVAPSSVFLGKVLTIAIAIGGMLLVHCLAVLLVYKGQFQEKRASLYGSVGTVASVFYIAVVSAVIGPLQCQDHPNGNWTCRVYPSVRCWESDEHTFMVVVSAVAMLVPLLYLAFVTLIVRKYPAKVLQGSTRFLKSFNFLFFRFTPQSYWYILVHIIRSLLLAVLPVVPNVIATIYLMQLTMVFSTLITVRFLPWRVWLANCLDTAFSVAVLVLLNTAGFFAPEITENDRKRIAWFTAVVVLMACSALPPILIYTIYVRCRPGKKIYQFFLCHHKVGAGAFVRMLKLVLLDNKLVTRKVFIDSDHLENLDELFKHVREETEDLVVIASRELFLRPWCMGEIVTTYMTHRQLTLVRMYDYGEITDDLMNDYGAHVEATVLSERGISQEMISDALGWVRTLPYITMPSRVTEEVVVQLSSLLAQKSKSGEVVLKEVEARATDLGICADTGNNEALSAALCLRKMLWPLLAQAHSELLPYIVPPAETLPLRTTRTVVVCTSGCLESPPFIAILCALAKSSPATFPVVAEEAFRFPAKAQIGQLRSIIPEGNDPDSVVLLIEGVFTKIAASFHAHFASETALRTAADTIKARVVSMKAGNSSPQVGSPRPIVGERSRFSNSGFMQAVTSTRRSGSDERSSSKAIPTSDNDRNSVQSGQEQQDPKALLKAAGEAEAATNGAEAMSNPQDGKRDLDPNFEIFV